MGGGPIWTSRRCERLSFIACLSIWNAVHGRGPFTEQSPAENMLTLQLFLIVVAVSLLVLAILIQERQRTEEALREARRASA